MLGTDLSTLALARGVPLTSCREITTLRSPDETCGSFALDFEDGVRLKGRRLRSADQAHTVERLRRKIRTGLAQILRRRGEALLEEWVEGSPLDTLESVPSAVMQACGRTLGALHRTPVDDPIAGTGAGLEEFVAKLERNLETLRAAGWLDEAAVDRAFTAAREAEPRHMELGIIHKDFCAENVVLDHAGTAVCVDNADLCIGPLDYDLARTWYRWPMTRSDLEHFVRGYENHRSLTGFLRYFRFWATCALAGSAAFRARTRTGLVHQPVGRLLRLIEAPVEGAGQPHPFWVS